MRRLRTTDDDLRLWVRLTDFAYVVPAALAGLIWAAVEDAARRISHRLSH